MNKNALVATVAGAVVLMVVGYVLWGILLMDVYTANAGPAGDIMMDPPNWLWLIIGQLATAALLVIVLGWKGATDVASGFKTAALVGVVMAMGIGFTMLGTTTVSTLTTVLIDIAGSLVHFGAAGAVIGMLLGKSAA